MQFVSDIEPYLKLMRFDKPIGILLLLWPTLWALWLAGAGHPDKSLLFIFVFGVIVMRAAGCVINDIADKNFDGYVKRTFQRPLVAGKIPLKNAQILFVSLLALAFLLVLMCNWLTIKLAFVGAALATIYPFLKRFTHLPQIGLGLAFSWGVPMAFAAQTNNVPSEAWLLFAAASCWPVIYDTFYAMADRADDVKIGVKSTAIFFGKYDKALTFILQIVFLAMMYQIGQLFSLDIFFNLGMFAAALLFLYQQKLIKLRDPKHCFTAFLNNNWVGLVIFLGITLSIK